MKIKSYFLVLAAMLPCLALGQGAESYECSFENLKRRVQVLSEPGVTVPCEVHYYKDSEMPGQRQVLWTALTEEGYCEKKTEEFVATLRGWGWECNESAPAPMAEADAVAESEPAEEEATEVMDDDTEALEPAE